MIYDWEYQNTEKFTRGDKTETFQLGVEAAELPSKCESEISVSVLQYFATIQSRKRTFKIVYRTKTLNFSKEMKGIY